MIKVSFIIPIYNVNKYLEECLDTIYSIKGNYEVILIDDCGTERPDKIIDKFSDEKTKVIKHSVNKGLGEARNTGLKNVSEDSTHIYFMDSDDIIDSAAATSVLANLKEGVTLFRKYLYIWTKKIKKIDGEKNNLHKGKFPFGATGTFYEASLIKNFYFWKKTYEDAPWTLKLLNGKPFKYEFTEVPLIYYRIRKSSINRKKQTVEDVQNYNDFVKYLIDNNSNSVDRREWVYDKYLRLSKKDRKKIRGQLIKVPLRFEIRSFVFKWLRALLNLDKVDSKYYFD